MMQIYKDRVMYVWWAIRQWTSKDWWRYLLAPIHEDQHRIQTFICRVKGHPYGVIWYNAGGLEPDMTCKNCGDDLG